MFWASEGERAPRLKRKAGASSRTPNAVLHSVKYTRKYWKVKGFVSYAKEVDGDSAALLGAEGLDGVDGGGAARRQIAGEERCGDEAERSCTVSDGIDGAHFEQER